MSGIVSLARIAMSCGLVVVAAVSISCSGEDPADFVFTNGRIYTLDELQPWAEAVAVSGDEIVYVGDNGGAKAYQGEKTQAVDLQGHLMLPGFVESHIHIALGGATTSGVILNMSDSRGDVLRKVSEYAEAHPEKKVIVGASYNGLMFSEMGPNKVLLDQVVADRPVYLLDHTLHSVWVNSKALELAGITGDTPDPPGGQYLRGADGEPSGGIQGGAAHIPVANAIFAFTAESMSRSIPQVLEGLSEYGFTSAIDMGTPIAPEAAYRALVNLDEEGKLPLRVSMTYYVNTASLAETAVEKLDEFARKYRSDNAWINTLKITLDSVLENQKAAMLEPYPTTGNPGALYFDHEQMKSMVLGAAAKGYHVTVHCIGDLAVRATLDAAEEVRGAGHREIRFSTTHTQMVNPADRGRLKQLDVTVQTTGNWAMQQPALIEHLGQERYDRDQFPFRAWADDSVNIAMGADWPATPGGFEHGVNPFNNIYTAMHRRPPAVLVSEMASTGDPLPPVDQVLTLEEAIRSYTLGGARMLGIDDQVGSIVVGKKADLILLSQNLFEIPPDELPNTRVLATMMGGKVVHDVTYGLGDPELVDLETLETGVGTLHHRSPDGSGS